MASNLAYNNMAGTETSSTPREPEVLTELSRLTNCCEALDKLAVELEDRLKGVLAQRAEGESKPCLPEAIRVPLAQAFHDRVVSLDSIAGRLSSVINRLEI